MCHTIERCSRVSLTLSPKKLAENSGRSALADEQRDKLEAARRSDTAELATLSAENSQFYVLVAFWAIIRFMSPTVFREKKKNR